MESITLLGQELLLGTPTECKARWISHPEDRPLIATHDEANSHDFDSPAQIAAWLEQKRKEPGKYQLLPEEKRGRISEN